MICKNHIYFGKLKKKKKGFICENQICCLKVYKKKILLKKKIKSAFIKEKMIDFRFVKEKSNLFLMVKKWDLVCKI